MASSEKLSVCSPNSPMVMVVVVFGRSRVKVVTNWSLASSVPFSPEFMVVLECQLARFMGLRNARKLTGRLGVSRFTRGDLVFPSRRMCNLLDFGKWLLVDQVGTSKCSASAYTTIAFRIVRECIFLSCSQTVAFCMRGHLLRMACSRSGSRFS